MLPIIEQGAGSLLADAPHQGGAEDRRLPIQLCELPDRTVADSAVAEDRDRVRLKIRPVLVGAPLLEKKATPAAAHWSRSNRAQSGCMGRAPGPLSPPQITQSSFVTPSSAVATISMLVEFKTSW